MNDTGTARADWTARRSDLQRCLILARRRQHSEAPPLPSAAHLLWVASALARLQHSWASIELPSALESMQGGEVWRALIDIYEVAGYQAHVQRA